MAAKSSDRSSVDVLHDWVIFDPTNLKMLRWLSLFHWSHNYIGVFLTHSYELNKYYIKKQSWLYEDLKVESLEFSHNQKVIALEYDNARNDIKMLAIFKQMPHRNLLINSKRNKLKSRIDPVNLLGNRTNYQIERELEIKH
ncbi:hypothetical protein BpHYR1_045225 [Brachionus plicatilis]|uniref:Uncharacterized protein n=1 Tax=Brachionus plicatilis TaxID=10195 RepID=A0A3M7R4G3_BRAPC|nr:hypothetical protein BpHYR1_045225 [Brachionus plicatilis]